MGHTKVRCTQPLAAVETTDEGFGDGGVPNSGDFGGGADAAGSADFAAAGDVGGGDDWKAGGGGGTAW